MPREPRTEYDWLYYYIEDLNLMCMCRFSYHFFRSGQFSIRYYSFYVYTVGYTFSFLKLFSIAHSNNKIDLFPLFLF